MSNIQNPYHANQNMHYNTSLTNNTYSYGNSNISISVAGKSSFNDDVEINANLKVKGIDIVKLLEGIQSRLHILIPDPEKLEHYESLKKAYNHYKMLEALCEKK